MELYHLYPMADAMNLNSDKEGEGNRFVSFVILNVLQLHSNNKQKMYNLAVYCS